MDSLITVVLLVFAFISVYTGVIKQAKDIKEDCEKESEK